ncbi:F-box/LRR-repeat protein 7-like isoform X2 [Dendronephthya gigantea]|uniref:F-box/LRR-repeat protein 7-like isoform X2 n=1 Tax=Dendronephthya gigantea TaxID=151771 RepID=UPI001069A040|nr:F-box/LRR-repeat protein 7-like isoform X2 [Dendronephthya gigantea]
MLPITIISAHFSFREKTKGKAKNNDVYLTEPKIFVGNISYKLSTLQLKEFFSSFGRVIFAQIVKDKVKKRSKGYGFVTFSRTSEVERVLQASDDELILDGRTLRVNRAEKKRRSRAIQENTEEKNPEKSIENFVQKYMESSEISECEMDDGDNEETDVKIYRLNDDILLYIFMFLTIKERVKIERVCQRWRQLARQTWLVLTHLDFKDVFVPFQGTGGLTDRILLSLFKRGCQNLRSLDLSHSSRLLSDYALYMIGQNCPELQEVNLSGVNATMKSLKEMSGNCRKLKKITLQRCYEVGEKALWWLFKQCSDLEYIDVEGNIRITGQCFFMLTEKCRTVIADDCMKLTDDGLGHLAKRCGYLQELSISNCMCLTDSGISDLFMRCTKLKRLSFCNSSKQITTNSLLALRHLTELEELELAKQDPVNDSVMFVIGSNCVHLRVLDLEACHQVTDKGIQCLASCFQLEKLVISYMDEVTDASVISIAQNGTLREFHARSCVNLSDRAVMQVALHNPCLQVLDLSGSDRIRNGSLTILEEILGDKEGFILSVGGTAVTMDQVLATKESCPSWDITTQDLSDYHLRTDFDPYMDMGRIMPEYSDSDEEGPFQFNGNAGYDDDDADYYLSADDPSAWEYQEQWMS